MYKRLIFFLLILASFTVAANAPLPKQKVITATPKTLRVDSSNTNFRGFNQRALTNYSNDPEFNYHNINNAKYQPSLWDRFWKWFWDLISRLFKTKQASGGGSIIQFFLIAGAVIGLIFLIVKLIGANLSNMFSRQSKQIAMPYSESLENIHDISFDAEIESALAQRNYKLAVRLLYLASLKHLNDANLIHWQIDKTNNAYLEELSNTDQRQSFSVLTRQFEYVWYGNFPVDGRSFQNIRTLFLDFKKLLP
jgi:hypothetical protein